MKVEAIKPIALHRNVRVSEEYIPNFRSQGCLATLQILKQRATRLPSRMPHSRDETMQSRLKDGVIQQITQRPFGMFVVETGSVTLQTSDMPDPIQHIPMQKHIAADSPERGAPDKGRILFADG